MSQKHFEMVMDGVIGRVTTPEKLILLMMAFFADDEGWNIALSRTRIASMAVVSEKAVDQIIGRFLDDGVIERGGGGADTNGSPARYCLHIGRALDLYGDKPRAEAGPSSWG